MHICLCISIENINKKFLYSIQKKENEGIWVSSSIFDCISIGRARAKVAVRWEFVCAEQDIVGEKMGSYHALLHSANTLFSINLTSYVSQ